MRLLWLLLRKSDLNYKEFIMKASYKGEEQSLPEKAAWNLSVENLGMEGSFEFHPAGDVEIMTIFRVH